MEMQELINEIREETRGYTLGGELAVDGDVVTFSLEEFTTGTAFEHMIKVIRKHMFSWKISNNEMVIHK